MKRLVLGMAWAGLLLGSANAADMRVKAVAPIPVAVANWTGCYIGGDIGWYTAKQDGITSAFPSPGFGAPAINGGGIAGYGVLPTSHGLGRDGAIGGGFAGCNYQVNKFVFGIEGDVSWIDRNSSDARPVNGSFATVANFPVAGTNMRLNASNDWVATLRGRLGLVVGPTNNWMIYGTGGVALTETRYSAAFTPSTDPTSLFGFGCPAGGACFGRSSATLTQQKAGWVAGAGVEWMLTPNWLVRAEYLHYQFEGASGVVPAVLASGAAACAGCGWNANWSDLKIDSVRVGLSYKFGWASPVMAKY